MSAAGSSVLRVHGLSFALATGVATLLLLPIPAPPSTPGWTSALPLDKVVHFVLFLIAARPWRRSMEALGFRFPGLTTLILATTYAGLLELLQSALTTTRSAEVADVVAGSLGALVGAIRFGEMRGSGVPAGLSRRAEPEPAPQPQQPQRPQPPA